MIPEREVGILTALAESILEFKKYIRIHIEAHLVEHVLVAGLGFFDLKQEVLHLGLLRFLHLRLLRLERCLMICLAALERYH